MAQKRSRAAYEADLQAQQSPYVLYGTPLPPLDPSVRDDGSYVPVWKQVVTDEQGRRRLHGAFTGGFSAGYFNTVGSKEGWTPSSFVSSRSNRNKDAAVQQKPEDFMDDEDLVEQEESRKIATREAFSALGSTTTDVEARATIMDLLRPAGETMGTTLLRKMGWRDGQGIGPRVRRKARGDDSDDNETDGNDETHLFAPDDTPVIAFIRKTDRKGLGFGGEEMPMAPTMSTADDSDNDEPTFGGRATPKKKVGTRGGIGIGVLNDTGSDDEDDPYSMGPRLSYSRVIGGKETKKKKGKKALDKPSSNANPLLTHKPILVSKRNALKDAFRKCYDGRLPLPGFIVSATVSASPVQLQKYLPPSVPPDWKSAKASAAPIAPSAAGSRPSTTELAKASTHDPSTRGAALGVTRLPGKSVFSFLTPAARDRLAHLTSNPSLPLAGSETLPTKDNPTGSIPALDASVAAAALERGAAGFAPYAEDAEKQARYREFLAFRAGVADAPAPTPPPPGAPAKARADWALELQEFARAADIFRPMSDGMASRFAPAGRAAASSTGDDSGGGDTKTTASEAVPAKPADAARQAAALGMFGPLTRSEAPFAPTRLLCKRFGVPPPVTAVSAEVGAPRSGGMSSGGNAKAPLASRFASSGFQGGEPVDVADEAKDARGGSEGSTVEESGQAPKIDPARNPAIEQDRPGEDLFRAVFGSDSEDE